MPAMPTEADTSWAQKWFSEKYEPWFLQVEPLIETHQYGLAFKTYPFLGFDQTPWSPVRIPLADVRLGVVSTAGLYRRDVDSPFTDAPDGEGDSRVIELPRDVTCQSLATAHSHIPHDLIEADVNVALPLDHLRAFVRGGRIGEVAPRIFSLIGSRGRADLVATETAPRIAAGMKEDGVTLGLVIPAWPVCHQTGGLVAREIEARGIPTITMANYPAIIQRVRPPRWVHVHFPRGAMFGEPGNGDKHRSVLEGALSAATAIAEPGGKIELPYRWEAPPVSWKGRQITDGP